MIHTTADPSSNTTDNIQEHIPQPQDRMTKEDVLRPSRTTEDMRTGHPES